MGTIYKYSCDKCGFEGEYSIGGGFFLQKNILLKVTV